jgi:hypothetical protein
MIAHIEQDCVGAPRGSVPPLLTLRVVNDAEEIRNSVIAELPLLRQCTLCQRVLDEDNRDCGVRHLMGEHLDELYIRE